MKHKNKTENILPKNITNHSNQKFTILWRIFFYITGMLVLAFGIMLNTKSGLGVSPLISVSFVASHIFNQNFGDMTLVLYSSYIILEIVIHLLQKRYKTILFDLTSVIISTIAGMLLLGKPVGIGIGTLLAAILVGRIVALFNGLFRTKMICLAGLQDDM